MTDSAIPANRMSNDKPSDKGLALPPLLTALLRQAATAPAAGKDATAADWLALMAEGQQP